MSHERDLAWHEHSFSRQTVPSDVDSVDCVTLSRPCLPNAVYDPTQARLTQSAPPRLKSASGVSRGPHFIVTVFIWHGSNILTRVPTIDSGNHNYLSS